MNRGSRGLIEADSRFPRKLSVCPSDLSLSRSIEPITRSAYLSAKELGVLPKDPRTNATICSALRLAFIENRFRHKGRLESLTGLGAVHVEEVSSVLEIWTTLSTCGTS